MSVYMDCLFYTIFRGFIGVLRSTPFLDISHNRFCGGSQVAFVQVPLQQYGVIFFPPNIMTENINHLRITWSDRESSIEMRCFPISFTQSFMTVFHGKIWVKSVRSSTVPVMNMKMNWEKPICVYWEELRVSYSECTW